MAESVNLRKCQEADGRPVDLPNGSNSTYKVDDMTCGHCVGVIKKAIGAADAGAKVQVDLAQHLVHVEPDQAAAEILRDAIAQAGYTPVAVQASNAGVPARSTGCCCGSTNGTSSCRA